MSKSSKKAKAKKAREKRELEQERLDAGNTAANRAETQKAVREKAGSRRQASNAYAGVAGMGAATVGQLRLFRLLNLFTIMSTLTLAAALFLGASATSDAWAQAALSFVGYGGIDEQLASPSTLVAVEGVFALVIALLGLVAARWGKAWLRGDGTYRRFIVIAEVCGAAAIGWVVVCFFLARVIEPISSIFAVVFLVMLATIIRLHRERGR